MALFTVWSEGYQATGESGQAMLIGIEEAQTFPDACEIVADKWRKAYPKDADHWRGEGDGLTLWGCRLFATEDEARRSYG